MYDVLTYKAIYVFVIRCCVRSQCEIWLLGFVDLASCLSLQA